MRVTFRWWLCGAITPLFLKGSRGCEAGRPTPPWTVLTVKWPSLHYAVDRDLAGESLSPANARLAQCRFFPSRNSATISGKRGKRQQLQHSGPRVYDYVMVRGRQLHRRPPSGSLLGRVGQNASGSNRDSKQSGAKIKDSRLQRITAGIWSNVARAFFALWYLLGSLVHVKFGLTNNHIYATFGTTALFAASRNLWSFVVMPNITFFALLLAAFEMITGILILSKGRYVKIGLVASVLFNLFLVQLGLGYPEIPWSGSDFLLNRLPNLLFALLQLPLFWVHFNKSLPEFLGARLP